jgi:hypothetical protein
MYIITEYQLQQLKNSCKGRAEVFKEIESQLMSDGYRSEKGIITGIAGISIIPGEVSVSRYKDKKFANWQINTKRGNMSMVFHNLFDALIYAGIVMQGVEINSATHLMGFIQDILKNNKGTNNPLSQEDVKRFNSIAMRDNE